LSWKQNLPFSWKLLSKFFIAACSPLLTSTIQLSPNPGVIYLNKISIKNLNIILDFMYKGEAYVASEDLKEFLAATDKLSHGIYRELFGEGWRCGGFSSRSNQKISPQRRRCQQK